jgi:hypothetical protein
LLFHASERSPAPALKFIAIMQLIPTANVVQICERKRSLYAYLKLMGKKGEPGADCACSALCPAGYHLCAPAMPNRACNAMIGANVRENTRIYQINRTLTPLPLGRIQMPSGVWADDSRCLF